MSIAMTGRRTAAAIAIAALALLATPGALAAGPSIVVTSPPDGGFSNSRQVMVEGCATAPPYELLLGSAQLGSQGGVNMAWVGGGLRFKPVERFGDGFSEPSLNTSRWSIVRNTGHIAIEQGELRIYAVTWQERTGLVESVPGTFPTNSDWIAEFKLRFDQVGWIGGGGGFSDVAASTDTSTAAVQGLWTAFDEPSYKVYENGKVVLNQSSEMNYRVYTLIFKARTGVYDLLRDGESLGQFMGAGHPSMLWFGNSGVGTGWWSTNVRVDDVSIWGTSGSWTSRTYDFGHNVSVDRATASWTSTHATGAVVELEARASSDNATWSAWTPVSATGAGGPLLGRYAQLRSYVSLPVRNRSANLTISSFKLTCHDPVTSVEVRREGGEWSAATGLGSWSATLALEEDANVVEVRAMDTNGAVNVTSLTVIVDTVPPRGTVNISQGRAFTNDLDVTLHLNASDRWGVSYVRVSNAPDMFNKLTFTYAPTVHWHLEGVDGEVPVYVRFEDSHGLLSDIVSDSIIYDTFPPTGAIKINGGATYAPSLVVGLDLDYSDPRGVALVEVSNGEGFSYGTTVKAGERTVPQWRLAEGGDGPRTVFMRLTDVAGNVAVVNSTVEVYIPKRMGSLTIEEGAPITRKTIVGLGIDAPAEMRVTRMQVANDPSFGGAEWEGFAREKLWILPPGDGPKTVLVRFEDFRRIVSLPVNATIVVDTTPPEAIVTLEGGLRYTTSFDLTAYVEYKDASPPGWMWAASSERFDLVEAQPFSANFCWTIPAFEGDQSLFVKVEDLAGNAIVARATIHYSLVHPQLRLELPGGPVSSAVDQVPVTAVATDPYGDVTVQLAFGHDPSEDAPWFPAYGPLSTTVPFGTPDGVYEIRGRAKNAAGLVSEVASVTVKLDRNAPTVDVQHPRQGESFSQKGLGVLLAFSAYDLNGISNVSYRVEGGGWIFIPSTARSVPVALDGFGEHTIMVRVLDGAGNPGTGSSTFEVQRTEPRVASGGVMLLLLVLILMLAILAVLVYRTRRGRAGRPATTPSGPPQPAPPPEVGTSRVTEPEPRPGASTPEASQGTGPTRTDWEEY
jgi:hypothetical protein